MNDSDNRNLSDVEHFFKWDDCFIVTVWSIILTYGLATNLLTLYGVWRNKSMRSATSYWLILSVAVCDIMMIVISLTHLLPATLFHDNFVRVDEYRNAFAIFLYNVFWYSGVVQLAGMAINRYVNIVHAAYYTRLFTPCYTSLFLIVMYTVGVAASVPALFPCCLTVYDHELWVTYFSEKDSDYYLVDLILNSLSVTVMIFCYACILWKVRKSRSAIRRHKLDLSSNIISLIISTSGRSDCSAAIKRKNCKKAQRRLTANGLQPSRREMKLLTQFLIVSVVFLLTFLMWQWLFKLPSDSKWIYFTTTTFFFVNNAVNPTVYLIYNSTLRKELAKFLPASFLYIFHGRKPLNATATALQREYQSEYRYDYDEYADDSNDVTASVDRLNSPATAFPPRPLIRRNSKDFREDGSCVNRNFVEIETMLNR